MARRDLPLKLAFWATVALWTWTAGVMAAR
jgi:hypothetical protein